VGLKLETSNRLPFKDRNKAAWTKQERMSAMAADCPESLEGFSQTVSLLLDFISFFHFTDHLYMQLKSIFSDGKKKDGEYVGLSESAKRG
jgi:hypothetical protein